MYSYGNSHFNTFSACPQMARLLILFAALGLTTAAPQLVFNADDGKRTAITFDGTTLNVPQHCRSDTCNTFDARMNAMDERFNTMSLRIDGVVQSVADLAKTLADHKAIASTDEERGPTKVLTPVSVPYGLHIHSWGPPPRASLLPRE